MIINNLYTIGNKLYKARKSKGITQNELAEQAELSLKAYAEIERGNVNMRVETLLNICKVLDISPNELLIEPDSSSNTVPDEKQREQILESLCSSPVKKQVLALKVLELLLNTNY